MKLLKVIAGVAATLMFITCTPDFPDGPGGGYKSGDADFAKYVSVGNSLTAGVQNGGLRQLFQQNSYPYMIARQLGKTSWAQPTIADSGTTGSLYLTGFTAQGKPILYSYAGATTPNNLGYAPAYDNLGIPTLFLYDFFRATGTSNMTSWQQIVTGGASTNPLIDVVLRGKGTQFKQLKSLQPTFVSFWLGNNDILGYATGGAGNNGNPVTAGVMPPTSINDGGLNPALPGFRTMYNQALDSLLTIPDCRFVVANIPDVSSIAYMTTVKLADVDSVQVAPGVKMKLYYAEDPAGNRADIKYFMLSLSSALPSLVGAGIGLSPANPIPGKYTMTHTEAGIVKGYVDSYNLIIDSAATARNIPVVNVNDLLKKIAAVSGPLGSGYPVGSGIKVKTDYITGGIFSLDGVHPTTLGYAIIANEFIKTINEYYDSTVPQVNINQYMIY